VLRHSTEMSVEKNDVDTHGQSEARRLCPTGGPLTMP
jgi:hypothetical protein